MQMSISKHKVESFSAIIQDLSENLRIISSYSKFMQPKCINLEMKNFSNSVQQISPILLKGEAYNHRNKFSSEIAEISYGVDRVLQSYSTNTDIRKVASELKAIRTKLEKISKKLQSDVKCYTIEENPTKMTLENTRIETLTISDKREDKENIINLLLQSEPCIVPIIHKYKSNSTECARDVFEDKRVSNHFSRTVWVDAPRLIDVKKLKNIAKRRPSTLFWVIKTLNKDLEEKKVLLVLDDIKKELELGTMRIRRYPMKTINKVVIGTSETGYVNGKTWTFEGSKKLSVEEAWTVMIKYGIDIGNMELYEGIGKEILCKMERWEETVQALGILLSRNMEVAFWKMMAESQFWRIPCHEDDLLSLLVMFCYDFSLLGYEIHYI